MADKNTTEIEEKLLVHMLAFDTLMSSQLSQGWEDFE